MSEETKVTRRYTTLGEFIEAHKHLPLTTPMKVVSSLWPVDIETTFSNDNAGAMTLYLQPAITLDPHGVHGRHGAPMRGEENDSPKRRATREELDAYLEQLDQDLGAQ